tara:strand:- start:86 stop:562 length:477 start_codon:yes stop_codon:yes gene_type:complete
VDPLWTSADNVRLRIRKAISGIQILGPDETGLNQEPPGILLNGEPLELPETPDVEPGVVVVAKVPYGRADPTVPEATAKYRPVVVTKVYPGHVVVRPIYSKNAEGHGQRLREPVHAGLKPGAVVANDEEIISLDKIGVPKGRLMEVDRRLVGLPKGPQ